MLIMHWELNFDEKTWLLKPSTLIHLLYIVVYLYLDINEKTVYI